MSKSRNTTAKTTSRLAPIHPGEILREALADLNLSMNQLAKAIGVPANRINAIVGGQRSIIGETALCLARIFREDPGVLFQHAGPLRIGDGAR